MERGLEISLFSGLAVMQGQCPSPLPQCLTIPNRKIVSFLSCSVSTVSMLPLNSVRFPLYRSSFMFWAVGQLKMVLCYLVCALEELMTRKE